MTRKIKVTLTSLEDSRGKKSQPSSEGAAALKKRRMVQVASVTAHRQEVYQITKDKSITQDTDPASYILKFGAHKGQQISAVPQHYLQWMVSNVQNRPDVVELVKKYLASQHPLQEFIQTVVQIYTATNGIDITQLSSADSFCYGHYLDTARQMQAVIDRDNGVGSPEAHRALCALQATLPR